MAELQIKAEYLPARCEVCHQTDYFDAQKNYCSRCAEISVPDSSKSISNNKEQATGWIFILSNLVSKAREVTAWISLLAFISMVIAENILVSMNPFGNGPWPNNLPRPKSYEIWLVWRNISLLIALITGIISLPKKKAVAGLILTILYFIYRCWLFATY